jgi:hypothetical protein
MTNRGYSGALVTKSRKKPVKAMNFNNLNLCADEN